MELSKLVEISELLEIYGGLLTDKQKEVMQLYYDEDLSLGEISQELHISRQAVHDTLKKSEKFLYNYEEILHLHDKMMQIKNNFKEIRNELKYLSELIYKKEQAASVEIVKQLINRCEELSE